MGTEEEPALSNGEEDGSGLGQQVSPQPPPSRTPPVNGHVPNQPSGQLTAAQKEGIRKDVEKEPQKVVLRVEVRRPVKTKVFHPLGYPAGLVFGSPSCCTEGVPAGHC